MAIFSTVDDIEFISSYAGVKVLNDAISLRLIFYNFVESFSYMPPAEFTDFDNYLNIDSLARFAIRADNALDKLAPLYVDWSQHTTGNDFTMYSAWDQVPLWASADAIFNQLGITRIKASENFNYALNAQWLFDYLRVMDQMRFAVSLMYPVSDTIFFLFPFGRSGNGDTWAEAEADYLASSISVFENLSYQIGYGAQSDSIYTKAYNDIRNNRNFTIPAVDSAVTRICAMGPAELNSTGVFVASPSVPQLDSILITNSYEFDETGGRLEELTMFSYDEFDSMPSPPTAGHGFSFNRYNCYYGLDGTQWPELTGA